MSKELVQLLEMADKRRDEIVICLIGEPGIGKTQSIYEFAKKHNRNVVEIIASQCLPSEVSGIAMPDPENKSMSVFDNERIASMQDGDILFLDEVLTAPQAVLFACLTMVQERRLMSGKKLNDIMIVAAANYLTSADRLPLSIRQRFMFYDVRFDFNDWREYIKRTRDVDPEPLRNLISTESNRSDRTSYNVLTPRSATKLIDWMLVANGYEEISTIDDAIRWMFTAPIADKIKDICCSASANKQVVNAVENAGVSLGITWDGEGSSIINAQYNGQFVKLKTDRKVAKLEDIKPDEILTLLEELDGCSTIFEALAEVEMY